MGKIGRFLTVHVAPCLVLGLLSILILGANAGYVESKSDEKENTLIEEFIPEPEPEPKPAVDAKESSKVPFLVESKRKMGFVLTEDDGEWEFNPGLTYEQKIVCASLAAAILLIVSCCCVCICKICCGNNARRQQPQTSNIVYQQLTSPVLQNNKTLSHIVPIPSISSSSVLGKRTLY